MAIDLFQNDPAHRERYFESSHCVYVPVTRCRILVVLTGIVKLDFQGKNIADWYADQLRLHLDFSQICSPDQWFGVENWAPFITISGVDIGGDNQYGGCAIDAFGLEWKPYDRKIHEMINMWANLRVRGAGFSLFKISYSLTVSGLFVDPPEDPLLE